MVGEQLFSPALALLVTVGRQGSQEAGYEVVRVELPAAVVSLKFRGGLRVKGAVLCEHLSPEDVGVALQESAVQVEQGEVQCGEGSMSG